MSHSDDAKLNISESEGRVRQKNSSGAAFRAAMAILIILLLLSIIILAARLYEFVTLDKRELMLKSNLDTELELFSVEYENSTGEITVRGMDGEKVVAPGTNVDYTVRLRNRDNVAIDYELCPTAKFTTEHEIPILVRLLDNDEKYIAGSAKKWIKVIELNGIKSEGTLRRGESAEYTFQWKWPFESGDDIYDTFLGNEAIEEDIGIEVTLTVHAWANTDMDVNGGFFPSGRGRLVINLIIFLLLLTAIILLIIYNRYRTALIDVMTLNENFMPGDTVTLDVLKKKGLVGSRAEKLKITAKKKSVLNHALSVEIDGITKRADAVIRAAGGKVFNKNEKAK